ncbi:hypothetical protein AOLI_G00159300 [Acnodon oligacanthus]
MVSSDPRFRVESDGSVYKRTDVLVGLTGPVKFTVTAQTNNYIWETTIQLELQELESSRPVPACCEQRFTRLIQPGAHLSERLQLQKARPAGVSAGSAGRST